MAKQLSVLPKPWTEVYCPNTEAIRQHWWPSESLEPIGSRTYLGSISIFSCTIADFFCPELLPVSSALLQIHLLPITSTLSQIPLFQILVMVATRTGEKTMEEALAAIQAKL